MRLFHASGDDVEVLAPVSFQSRHDEVRVQAWADSAPALLNNGMPMLSLGREIGTRHGHSIDNLFLDGNRTVVAAEMKRGKTPRDVVAQVIDYAAHVSNLDWPDLERLCLKRQKIGLEAAFEAHFGRPLVKGGKPAHRLLILAESYDPRAFDAALYMINGGMPLALLQFTYFEVGGGAVLDVRSILGEIPEQPPVGTRQAASSAPAPAPLQPEEGYSAWLLGSIAQWLPDFARQNDWPLRLKLNKISVPFGLETWPLSLGDLQFRVDTYRQGIVSLRFSARREAVPGLREFLEERRTEWRDAFPAEFEAPSAPTPYMNLTLDLPPPAMGDQVARAVVQEAVAAMTRALVPLLDAYLAEAAKNGRTEA